MTDHENQELYNKSVLLSKKCEEYLKLIQKKDAQIERLQKKFKKLKQEKTP